MIQARTDTIRYEYSNIHYTTADTDTSTPCIGVPATCIIRPDRSLGECSLYAMGGTCTPLATNQLARSRSVSFKTGCFTGTLEWLTVDCCYHFLLVERVQRQSSVAGGQDPVLHRLGVMWRLVSGYSLLPPTPPTLSRVTWHECPLISSVMRPVNSFQICSDARSIGFSPIQQKPIRYDTLSIGSDRIYDTDPIIIRSL